MLRHAGPERKAGTDAGRRRMRGVPTPIPAAMLPDARTRPVVLLGHPVAHSLSPLLHNTAFRHQGVNAVYLAADVAPAALPAAVVGLQALGALGANVTLPHKQAALPLMETLSPAARAVGAVNTIVCRDGRLHGDNTDVAGFLAPLAPWTARLAGAGAVVLGAGGAARAVVYALLTALRPATLTVGTRHPEKASAFVEAMAVHAPAGTLRAAAGPALRAAVRAAALVVNATPVGMHPDVDRTPWPHPEDFGPAQLVYDLVYAPARTRLLAEAAAAGAATLGGLDMLLAQAGAAYRQWTGRPFPEAVVRAALPGPDGASVFPGAADTESPRPS